MRCRASTASKAMAANATTTVIGLVNAAKTRRIAPLFSWLRPRGSFRAVTVRERCSLPHLRNKGLNIAGSCRDSQKTTPYTQARQHIVDFRIRQQPLRLGYVIDVAEPRLVTRGCLLCSAPRRGHLDRCVHRDTSRAI